MTTLPKLGFIGTGNMGRHMAANLLKAGYALTVHDARKSATERLVSSGATWAESPAAVAAASEIVLSSLPGPADVEAVALGDAGIVANLPTGGVFVDLSTNAPTTMRKIYAAGQARGVHVLDAPVSGGVFGAESRRLAVMV
ncbi:MAG: NAD(P)-binding domain-containing protein, partial [Chloroflexi bacterium]|nr:NAD(P)-binding domain-containing protein [Chloroflexota bacterium]